MAKFYCPTKLSENISETPEGYLLCVGVPIARTGTMEYGEGETPLEVGDDGIVYVSREASEVFSKVTIASFEGKSVTIRHPEDFVTPQNWKELTKGTIQNVRRAKEKDDDGEEVLLADLLITDAFTIGLVKNGLREVSCGYEAEYEQTGAGKGRQTKIVGNHLALVEEGRAGSSYAIRDHKGKVTMKEKIAAVFKLLSHGKTMDQALAEIERGSKKTKTKIKDGQPTPKASGKGGAEEHPMPTVDSEAYDALKSAYDAMGKQLDSMKPQAKDEPEEEMESEDEWDKEEKKDESKDDAEGEAAIMERLKALEAAVSKLLESRAEDESEEGEESEESKDESEEEEESEDAALEGEEGEASQKKTGDAARAEILVPGFVAPKKGDLKTAVLREALKDSETGAVILALNGGKRPTLDSAAKVSALFIGASEIMKVKRSAELARTKATDQKAEGFESFDSRKEEMTPEKMNELNEHFWAQKAKA